MEGGTLLVSLVMMVNRDTTTFVALDKTLCS